jgi:hypothetical protein
LPTAITIAPGTTSMSPVVVTVVFNHGHTVRGGRYLIVINSGHGANGIDDVAGNALDGNSCGKFPSGDGLAGGNFAASIALFITISCWHPPRERRLRLARVGGDQSSNVLAGAQQTFCDQRCQEEARRRSGTHQRTAADDHCGAGPCEGEIETRILTRIDAMSVHGTPEKQWFDSREACVDILVRLVLGGHRLVRHRQIH